MKKKRGRGFVSIIQARHIWTLWKTRERKRETQNDHDNTQNHWRVRSHANTKLLNSNHIIWTLTVLINGFESDFI